VAKLNGLLFLYRYTIMKNHRHRHRLKKGGGCGCQTPKLNPFSGGCSTCNLPMSGGAFVIPPTANFPSTNETYYPLNNYQNDPTMTELSTRIQGVPVSHTLNETGGNNIYLTGGRKRKRTKKTKKRKSKKTKKRKNKKTKKQSGGINLGQSAISSYLGPGHYPNLLGSKVEDVPDQHRSIFTNPASLNNTGFSKTNPPLV